MSFRSVSALVLLTLLALVVAGGAGVAHAQSETAPPSPAVLQVADGENPGEVSVSWNAVDGASSWRVGWLAVVDYQEHEANDVWQSYFAYSDVATSSSWTVRRLTPGLEYYFIVGRKHAGDIAWSDWERFKLDEDATACPAYPPATGTARSQTVDDYIVWKIGEQVSATDADEIREAVIATHNTYARHGMPRIDKTVTIFLYHDPDALEAAFEEVTGRTVDARDITTSSSENTFVINTSSERFQGWSLEVRQRQIIGHMIRIYNSLMSDLSTGGGGPRMKCPLLAPRG